MKKLIALAAISGLAAGCAGHAGGGALIPGPSTQSVRANGAAIQSTATAPAGFAPTATKAFAGVLRGAADLGATPTTTTLTVRLGLQMRNVSGLQSAVASGQQISDSQFLTTYAPTAAQVSAVQSYLSGKGFTGITVEPNNLLVSATGTVAQVERAFATQIHNLSLNGSVFHANTGPAYVPSALSGIVVAVLGLHNAPIVHAGPKVTPCIVNQQNICVRFYDPNTFRTAYHASDDDGPLSNSPGGDSDDSAYNTTVAVMAEGNLTPAITDFRYNEKEFGLPQATLVVKPVGLSSPDTSGSDEWTLDMTYSTGIAGHVKTLYAYDTTSLTDSDIALEYSHWVTDNLGKVGNSSFGECEFFPYIDGAMLVDDMLFLEGAAHGQTMFASTGDTGGFCSVGVPPNGVPGGAPFVEYPATSPYVVAVGGTDLFTNPDGTYKGETLWEAGGGGVSQFEYAPYWEAEEQPVASEGESFRGAPDVAMDAALETGAILYLGGVENEIGGTSLASPLAVGSYAIMQTQHGNSLGFGPPRFYKDASQHPTETAVVGPPPTEVWGGFHDIILGTNGNPLDTAKPGYDYGTGLGSFNVLLMNSQIGAATP